MTELIYHLGIDWKLLAAQAVNFFVLLFVLKKFAYGPLIALLGERKRRIEEGVRMRREAEEELKNISVRREEIVREAEREALNRIRSADDIAKQRRDEAVKEAQAKGEVLFMDAKRRIEEEKGKMNEDVYKSASFLVRQGIAKVLRSMPADEKNKNLIDEAVRELRTQKP